MKIFGLEIVRAKAATMTAVPSRRSSWFGNVLESFSGAWQSADLVLDNKETLLAFSAVYACVTIIASDISKLPIKLIQLDKSSKIWGETTSPAFSPVLRKPNRYQTRLKFIEQWIVSKLLHGNSYALKERDQRGVVTALYVLDPQKVLPLVTESGDVYYQLNIDTLSGVTKSITVPASEIIHDMMVSLWHPLVGVSPLYACAKAGTMGNKIQTNSSKFFENMSRPSGHLTAPGEIGDETAARLKVQFEREFSGEHIGRLLVTGDGLKYEPMTIPAQAAQLIEQLKWTVDDVARAFHMPIYKLGGQAPTYNNIEALNQAYYNDCLQPIIEAVEICLREGIRLPDDYDVEFDLDALMRMDSAARYEAYGKAIAAGWMAPNEARQREGMVPVKGGESPMMQQQNWNLEQLAKRDIVDDKPSVAPPPAAPSSDDEEDEDEEVDAAAAKDVADLLAYIGKGLIEAIEVSDGG
jgi:HK97 family phage portal protein